MEQKTGDLSELSDGEKTWQENMEPENMKKNLKHNKEPENKINQNINRDTHEEKGSLSITHTLHYY